MEALVMRSSGVLRRGLDVVGLAVPPAGSVILAERQVVEVEAVGGGGLSGAGRVLPPEPGAVVALGQLQNAGQG
ncbi:hypothetical protein ACIRO3_35245 [Streptomyces sp. NPDC102278]|uniref:hypothetical protein n=1 Tax=Streptomyces sp. NPDC102278 TaxID=3366152 RepID=UPI00381F9297